MKKLLILFLVLILSLSLIACSTESEEPSNGDDTSDGELVLSTSELAEYNGQDGNPAYIAVDGVIYDVSDSKFWEEGAHNGFGAGSDLTEEIKDVSPHGTSVLDGLPVVGRLED